MELAEYLRQTENTKILEYSSILISAIIMLSLATAACSIQASLTPGCAASNTLIFSLLSIVTFLGVFQLTHIVIEYRQNEKTLKQTVEEAEKAELKEALKTTSQPFIEKIDERIGREPPVKILEEDDND